MKNPVEEFIVDFTYESEADDGSKTLHAYAIDGRVLLITKPNPTKLAELKKAEALLSPRPERSLKSPRGRTEYSERVHPATIGDTSLAEAA